MLLFNFQLQKYSHQLNDEYLEQLLFSSLLIILWDSSDLLFTGIITDPLFSIIQSRSVLSKFPESWRYTGCVSTVWCCDSFMEMTSFLYHSKRHLIYGWLNKSKLFLDTIQIIWYFFFSWPFNEICWMIDMWMYVSVTT